MRLACLLLATVLPLTAFAEPTQATRELFRDLSAVAQRGELASASDRLARLDDYPLQPYLVAADLRARLRRTSGPALDREIAAFVDANPALPPARSLRSAWLSSLGQRERWRPLLERVDEDDGTSLQCLATTAAIQLEARDASDLVEAGLAHWHHGSSQPEACNPVFAWLEARGALTRDQIVERARLAVLNNQYGLAEYLARKLPEGNRGPIQRWVNVTRNPGDLHTVGALRADIAVHAFKRLALRDLDGAAELAPELADRLDFDAGAVHEMRRYVALLYAQEQRPAAALAWFASLSDARMDDFARGWEVRAAALDGRWDRALSGIEAMPENQAQEEVWRYWRGRALAALGEREAADRVFAALARERSYHGYLAADQLDLPYQLNPDPLRVDDKLRAELAAHPAIRRARELLALERRTDARREWYAAIADMDQPRLRQAARLAHDWGWHPIAIITLARGDYWDDLDIRYPTHYVEAARERARENGIDPAYVLAVMRTESLFMPSVHSGAGAVGLMQLMPATARRVARRLDMPRPGIADLETPATNIRLGSRYIADMMTRFEGHLALASAAYNAGPHRVEDWLPQDIRANADVWIENIPYTETREYVQRVMAHMTVFQSRLEGEIAPLAQRLPAVPTADAISAELAANTR